MSDGIDKIHNSVNVDCERAEHADSKGDTQSHKVAKLIVDNAATDCNLDLVEEQKVAHSENNQDGVDKALDNDNNNKVVATFNKYV